MKAKFVTDRPTVYTIVAVLIFCFTSMVFLVYDQQVERRQRTVLYNANHASRIVSSLFPQVVRDRLFPVASNHGNLQARCFLRRYLNVDEMISSQSSGEPEHTGRPIADLFPSTTIMFADISGFTFWASGRDPEQVFLLLERLFGAFDAAARKRGVFKVETIGDSYVAVCGLPDACKHHALVMARFANDCRRAMIRLRQDLSATLGTGDLSLRRSCLV